MVQIDTHDYTSPHDVMTMNMHGVRNGTYGVWACTSAVVLLSILFSTVMVMRCKNELTRLQSAVAYLEDAVVPLSSRTENGAVIDVSLAMWARAYIAQIPAVINRAVELTCVWQNMKPVTWVGGVAEHDKNRMDSDIMSLVTSGAQRMAVQTALLREDPGLDAIYLDIITLLDFWDQNVHFNGFETCLGTMRYKWEHYAFNFLRSLSVNGGDGGYDEAVKQMVTLSEMCGDRVVPSQLKAYFERLEVMQNRSEETYNHQEVADILKTAVSQVNDNVERMILVSEEYFSQVHTVEGSTLPWMVLLYAWLSTMVMVGLYRKSSVFFQSIYYS